MGFIDELNVGDKVIVMGEKKFVCTVSRITKTQVVVANKRGTEYRFNKDNGYEVGGGCFCLVKYSDVLYDLCIKEELLAKYLDVIYKTDFQRLTTKQLEAICDIIEQ